jgi:hypothetical protein
MNFASQLRQSNVLANCEPGKALGTFGDAGFTDRVVDDLRRLRRECFTDFVYRS